MFAKYSWGDFGLFVLCLVILYYLVVILLYFRPQVVALFSGKKLAPAGAAAGPSPRRPRPSPAEDDLVSATSVYPSATKDEESDTADEETGAGAAQNLTSGQEQLIKGSLPASEAATGNNAAPTEVAASESTSGSATGSGPHQQEDEEIPLDRALEENTLVLPKTSIEKPTKEEDFSESRATFVDDESDIAYETAASTHANELEDYSVPLTSTLNIVSEQSAVLNADELSAYLTELQDGPAEKVPEKFTNTALGLTEEFSQKQEAAAAELDDMFASVNMKGM